ncbi:MAG TPA: pitrilysin family protein [Candidatus Baltobacteraceae bacterium]|nr:pitrilysin family protein [Candidatus Baltobacteraceae bacterium]
MNKAVRIVCAAALAIGVGICAQLPAAAQPLQVTRATLKNGLQVVVVHDPLAPVVSTMLNYRAGSNEQQYPGEAHALEHMMFRGTPGVSQTQLFEISQLMGGDYNADTQAEVTQYFFSVPAQYLNVALRVEADRAKHLTLAQSGWLAESGAIKQEVTQDDSVPLNKLFLRTILPSIFKGTPYAKDGLGTLYSFNHQINAAVLRKFYSTWYHPNNAVYVIAGNVDGPSTIKLVEKYFGSIPASKLPQAQKVALQPLKAATYHVDSDQPYSLIALAYRLPGWKDKDYAAAQILESVLNNQRGDLYGLVASGKALYAGFQDIESHAYATASAAISVVPVTTKADDAAADVRAVLAAYRKNGLPADLVEVAKQRAIADAQFRGNSIQGLAFEWSDAVAARGESSPDELVTAMKRVTLADVNRVLRTYIDPDKAIVAYAVPKNLGKVTSGASGPAKESNTLTPSKPQPLPAWAQAAFARVKVPAQTVRPVSMTLSNGMRLIVVPEHVTKTVEVHGTVNSNEAIQAPAGEQGVADIVTGLFSFGTTEYNRIQLREQLDAIAADVQAGSDFSLKVLSDKFDRGVQLLADEELHPAFPAQAFQIVKGQTVGALTGEMTSPDHLTSVALNNALFPADDPEQKFATPQTAASVTLEDVKSYFSSVYRPDMTSVVVIGDVTPEQAKATFEKYFGSWTSQGVKPDIYVPAVPKNKAASVVVPDVGRVQSDVQLAQVMDLPRANPDWALLTVANNILGGGGFGSLLMDDLRVKHGYVYGAYSSFSSSKNRATFTIGYACDPDKIVPAQQLALADLRSLQTGTISPERLTRSKAMLMSDVPLRAASFDGVANQLLRFASLGLPLDQASIDAQRELGATPSAVRAALTKWVAPGDFVRVVKGPGPK